MTTARTLTRFATVGAQPRPHRGARLLTLFGALLGIALATPAATAQVDQENVDVLVPYGATWLYLDDGSDQGTAWRAPLFPDGGWASGAAHIGYGDGDEITEVGYGPDPDNRYPTTYFRHHFNVVDPAAYDGLRLKLIRDDGAIVYLNGIEVARDEMPVDPIDYLTLADSTASGSEEDTATEFALDPADLVPGDNVLAVEVHQRVVDSSDISLDVQLLGTDGTWIERGPYLQIARPTAIQIRWRCSAGADGRVSYGTSPGALTNTVDDPSTNTGKLVVLTGLLPDTEYFYIVGTTTETLAGEGTPFSFRTPPLVGTRDPLRIWALGDSGTNNTDARRVRDAFDSYSGGVSADVMLMLGDIAYDQGHDFQYQGAVFETYADELTRMAVWPTRGNHETNDTLYYNIFSMPSVGQAGGVMSGTEAYYSFDVGNVHFICLDSTGSDRSMGGLQWLWLQSDLSSTLQDWIVAFWHHPPYSMGSHNSDTETILMEMRANFLPLLEAWGVDLVLNGHSHSYERSYLVDKHYGLTTELLPSMQIDTGDGNPAGDGPYETTHLGNSGAVYAVAGSSGKLSNMEPVPHPIMVLSTETLGSMVIDVDRSRLTGRFLDDTGTVQDLFVIEQEVQGTWTDLGLALAGTAGDPEFVPSGVLMEGTPVSVGLTSARPSSPALLFFGLARLDAPVEGGTLVPAFSSPGGGFLVLVTDGSGEVSLGGPWPAGIPSDFSMYFQWWIEDPAGPFGYASSNAVEAVTP